MRPKEDMYSRVIATAVLAEMEGQRKTSRGEKGNAFLMDFSFRPLARIDLIPSLSSSPLLVKPSTYHTGFLILSRDPIPRQQH